MTRNKNNNENEINKKAYQIFKPLQNNFTSNGYRRTIFWLLVVVNTYRHPSVLGFIQVSLNSGTDSNVRFHVFFRPFLYSFFLSFHILLRVYVVFLILFLFLRFSLYFEFVLHFRYSVNFSFVFASQGPVMKVFLLSPTPLFTYFISSFVFSSFFLFISCLSLSLSILIRTFVAFCFFTLFSKFYFSCFLYSICIFSLN